MEFQNIYRKNFMIDDHSFSEQSLLFIIPSGLNIIIHYSEPFYSHYSKFIIHLPPPNLALSEICIDQDSILASYAKLDAPI